jgi:hypothetical protein
MRVFCSYVPFDQFPPPRSFSFVDRHKHLPTRTRARASLAIECHPALDHPTALKLRNAAATNNQHFLNRA